MHILAVSGYWNPMAFNPNLCLIKKLCSIGTPRVDCEERVGYVEMNAKANQAMVLVDIIKVFDSCCCRTSSDRIPCLH